jgi:hypothetical protein
MRTVASSFLALAATLAAAAFANGCSAEVSCKPGNEKIDGECRLVCTTQDGCPADFSCVTAGGKSYCAKNPEGLGTGKGQFGSACNATLKLIENHPDCAAGFQCFGTSPTDADAYCSRYGCGSDSECPGGFYCATVNAAPNLGTYQRSWRGKTDGALTTVCKKRSTFCSPCASDADCAARGYVGPALHCVADDKGQKYCTNECANDAACDRDSACRDANGLKVCAPNVGACKGDGALCSRCASDADCKEGGFCLEQEYTKERFCTSTPNGGSCGASTCGTAPAGVPWEIGCVRTTSGFTPTDQCVGIRPFDDEGNVNLGCWAKSAGGK